MRFISMIKVSSHKLQPVYCSTQLKEVLPFAHKRIVLVDGQTFSSHEEDGKTIVSLKLGPGASDEPIFKTDFTKQVCEAIKELRIAACLKTSQRFADGFNVE